ncbi:ATP-dependent DNA helicase RecG [Candidatus Laterigemmans baculatus]|uniref:ATP-dependent DNA helicase RecG n=1 Tax=Candidatus Laterigemmans baculatus TaxID=2770505 RepID=UPI0013DD0601|nr:ATP-dependent DNA helicase RecG [Candidatus Laterigemmans baculatus]
MDRTTDAPAVTLATPAQYLRGVGPQRAELLARLGIRNAGDALFAFPRDYQHRAELKPIAELAEEQPASIVGTIAEVDQRVTYSGKSIAGVLVEDDTGAVRLMFFNQPFRTENLHRGDRVLVSGTPRLNGLRFEFVHPRVVPLDEKETLPGGDVLPVYPLTEGLKQPAMRRIMASVAETLSGSVPEVLPEEIRDSLGLVGIAEALLNIHRPENAEKLEAARRRLIFQELLVLQLALAMRRRRLTTDLHSPALPPSPEINARIARRFPFQLTGDQQRAIEEVGRDMSRQFPMNRLIQGDVGSGKTVVAQYAMLLAAAHKHQAVLMAPTDVLARQHQRTFAAALAKSRVRVGLFSGSLSAAERRETLRAAAAGEIDLLVGTHALLYGEIALPRLGLVVIDEQHKFGVAQRARLRSGGLDPHYLVLSATPIPRTVAMTMFGDLELSTLREKPPGRGVVKTYLAHDGWRDRWWQFVAERLDEGRQAFVVTPLVSAGGKRSAEAAADGDDGDDPLEDSGPEGELGLESGGGSEDLAAAESIYRELASGPLAKYRIGLLHGRMSPADKAETMKRFAEGRLQVLVATTVIEVGIDVPNATVMTILGAERFGLAQLHQLRGRVSRGRHTGHVGIFTGGPGSPEENERLQVLAETDDGFELAEADFRLRGPGDLMGVRQSGLPPLRIADPLRDADELVAARELAQRLIDEDPQLEAAGFEKLRSQVIRRYGQVLQLGDVA